MSRLLNYLFDAVRRPREQLSRGQHFVRHSWELVVHCYRRLEQHRADGMAAELTYRTIFSLIPVVVLGLVMFRIVGGLDEVQSKVENQLYSFFGVPEIPTDYLKQDAGDQPLLEQELLAADSVDANSTIDSDSDDQTLLDANPDVDIQPAIAATEADTKPAVDDPLVNPLETQRQARASIRRTLREVTRQVATLDFKSIGMLGLILFVYAAVTLANSTEQLFNRIYDAPSQRPIHIRLAIHWSIITLGSGLLAMSLYTSGQVVEWFGATGVGSSGRLYFSHFLSIVASWVLLFLLYALMPNTRVSVRAALIGALIGSLLWEGAKLGFQIYVTKAVPYAAIYGSLGLLPLFLFWVYTTWLIILFGLILTYTLQTLGSNWPARLGRHENALIGGDPDWMLPIMSEVGRAFEQGILIGNQGLADRLGLSSRIVHDMTNRLVDATLLRRAGGSAGDEDSLLLARPAEKISIGEILELAHQAGPTSGHPAWLALTHLKKAERDAANDRTLSEVLH